MKRQERIATYSLNIGDKVVKRSGRTFKSGRKIATIREFTTNPNSGHRAVVLEEDGTIVNEVMVEPLTLIN